ncbi:MAG: hypothetical protein GFH27_549281n25 [Chloroflexi bacterium AL-W]|nr:hypothetical protein [Chloroflexi bacterium AL-N10]NOK72792.1 hypothetical protein [Chloroflexi bacterium AL-N5]NOK79689.1 hypothetical protein [Chloroflexi bacterium AL-W]NOK93014.1 hypothetical protein [Chloroflexi bacterium AL-N15]
MKEGRILSRQEIRKRIVDNYERANRSHDQHHHLIGWYKTAKIADVSQASRRRLQRVVSPPMSELGCTLAAGAKKVV